MVQVKPNRFDKILNGFFAGLILPAVMFTIVYLVKYGNSGFLEYLSRIWQMKILLKIVSLCVFPNLGVFLLFLQIKYEKAARGVVMATFIYAFAVLIAKLL